MGSRPISRRRDIRSPTPNPGLAHRADGYIVTAASEQLGMNFPGAPPVGDGSQTVPVMCEFAR